MSLRGAAVLAVAAVALTSACSNSAPRASAPAPRPTASATPAATPSTTPSVARTGRYVAIGDSYTAGPGISPLDPASGGCLRSTVDYPALLAEELATNLTDVSCSGATTTSATDGGRGFGGDVAPQLDALTPGTDLVTVGIGGNDGGLFQNLLQSCSNGVRTCRQFVDTTAPRVLATTTDSVAALLGQVAQRSPKAQIVVVGYLRLSPDSGTCAALGVDPRAQDSVREAEVDLENAVKAAATAGGATFVSMREASQGHDACAGPDAWTNGATASDGDGIIFHPRPAGMQAVADQVARVAG